MSFPFSPASCECCGCKPRGLYVLLWDRNKTTSYGLSEAKAVYTGDGITAHLSSEWTGEIDEYGLIIWNTPTLDPAYDPVPVPWWPLDERWSGRVYLGTDYLQEPADPANARPSQSFINNSPAPLSVVGGTQILVPPPDPRFAVSNFGPGQFEHQLAVGQPNLAVAASAIVNAGGPLGIVYRALIGGAQEASVVVQGHANCVDWVVSGDTNSIGDNGPGNAELNKRFLLNLYDVPLPP